MREVALLPGNEPGIFGFPQWLPIVQNQSSSELWIDISEAEHCPYSHPETHKRINVFECLQWYIQHHSVKHLVFYDTFHADPGLKSWCIQNIQRYQALIPTTYLTICKNPILELEHVLHFDFYWNRTKHAYYDHYPTWKQTAAENYVQWPISVDHRAFPLLTLYGRDNWHAKKQLYDLVNSIPGYHSNPWSENVLPSNNGETQIEKLVATPPARRFFDSTYISAQIESMHQGPNVVLSEKTYDHLIQGRIVMNFGPRHYYRTLVDQGWRLPIGIDYSWDDIPDQFENGQLIGSQRFDAYIKCLTELSSDLDALHELFIANIDVLEHNHQQLQQRPYDIFNLEQLDHK